MKFFKDLIKILKTDGINSKQKVIHILSNLYTNELIEIRRQITEEINYRMIKGELDVRNID